MVSIVMFAQDVVDGAADVREGGGVLVVDFVAGGGVFGGGPEFEFFDEGVHFLHIFSILF